MSAPLRVDRLVGREVYRQDGHRLGRLEEFRAVRRDQTWIINEYVIGTAGLLERLGLAVRLIVGLRARTGYIARWDQLDLSDLRHLRLTCAVTDLEEL
jgi:hypothetical protein